jgi:hypothetical protein
MIMSSNYDIVCLGTSITSSWAMVHATTYRVWKGTDITGHNVLFLRERCMVSKNRDLAQHLGKNRALQSLMTKAKF